jgi:hypothetical protein
VTVDLVMQVSRDDRDRLSGTVRLGRAADTHAFSGTLELLRALEELVPADEPAPLPTPLRATADPRIDRERP